MGTNSWLIFVAIGIFHFIGNLFLTRDVFNYYHDRKERVIFYALVWCLPFAGAFYVFRKIGWEHYKTPESSTSGVSAGLLGMDEIFNPGVKAKYAIEEMVKDRNEVGAAYSRVRR